MSKVLEEITREVINLPRQERMALAGFLLELEEHDDESEARASWEQEILARIRAIDDGTAIGVSYDEVMSSAESRLP